MRKISFFNKLHSCKMIISFINEIKILKIHLQHFEQATSILHINLLQKTKKKRWQKILKIESSSFMQLIVLRRIVRK